MHLFCQLRYTYSKLSFCMILTNLTQVRITWRHTDHKFHLCEENNIEMGVQQCVRAVTSLNQALKMVCVPATSESSLSWDLLQYFASWKFLHDLSAPRVCKKTKPKCCTEVTVAWQRGAFHLSQREGASFNLLSCFSGSSVLNSISPLPMSQTVQPAWWCSLKLGHQIYPGMVRQADGLRHMGYVAGNGSRFRLWLASEGAHPNYSPPVSLEVTHAKTVKTNPLSLQIKNNDMAKVGECLIHEKRLISSFWKGESLKVHLAWAWTQPGSEGKQPGSPVSHKK